MSNKDFQNGFIAGAVSGGVIDLTDTTEMDALEDLIDNSGVLDSTDGTATEKVQQLIDIIKNYQNNNPEVDISENVLKSSDGYTLKDKDGLYLTTKESE